MQLDLDLDLSRSRGRRQTEYLSRQAGELPTKNTSKHELCNANWRPELRARDVQHDPQPDQAVVRSEYAKRRDVILESENGTLAEKPCSLREWD